MMEERIYRIELELRTGHLAEGSGMFVMGPISIWPNHHDFPVERAKVALPVSRDKELICGDCAECARRSTVAEEMLSKWRG